MRQRARLGPGCAKLRRPTWFDVSVRNIFRHARGRRRPASAGASAGGSCREWITRNRLAGGACFVPLERLETAEHRRQQLRHGRVDMDGALHHGVGSLGVHQVEDRVDDLIAADAEDGGAEELLGLGIDQHLHEALRLALLEGAAHVLHGHLGHQGRSA